MRLFLFFLPVLLCSVAVALSLGVENHPLLFRNFQSTHNKRYSTASEESHRFRIFSENMRKAEALNRANPFARFGPTPFSDLTAEEFRTYHSASEYYKQALAVASKRPRLRVSSNDGARCKGIDWRNVGVVSPVKDQGKCGSCWAFSAVGNIEGRSVLAGHPLTPLSEQQLVSCDDTNLGCAGGLMDDAFEYLLQERKGEVVTEKSIPYTSGSMGSNGQCPADIDTKPIGAVITGYDLLEDNEETWAHFMCSGGPLAIAVDASMWQMYLGGVMTDCGGMRLNHGVLAVGFSDGDGVEPPHWIIKNSWGPGFGENGYIRVAKGTGTCLIGQYAVTANVSSAPPPQPHPHPTRVVPRHFTQITCQDAMCSEGCKKQRYPLKKCYKMQIAGSAKAACTKRELRYQVFPFSTTCDGFSLPLTHEVNKCTRSWDGSYVKVLCE